MINTDNIDNILPAEPPLKFNDEMDEKEFLKKQKEYEKYFPAIFDEIAADISNQLGIPKELLSFENCNKAISKTRKILSELKQT